MSYGFIKTHPSACHQIVNLMNKKKMGRGLKFLKVFVSNSKIIKLNKKIQSENCNKNFVFKFLTFLLSQILFSKNILFTKYFQVFSSV